MQGRSNSSIQKIYDLCEKREQMHRKAIANQMEIMFSMPMVHEIRKSRFKLQRSEFRLDTRRCLYSFS